MVQATRERRYRKIHLRGLLSSMVSEQYVTGLCGAITPIKGTVTVEEYRQSHLEDDFYCGSCRASLARGRRS